MKALVISICLAMLPLWGFSQAPISEISEAVNSGSAKALAGYFDSNVEITIGSTEGAYSKTQAEHVVRDFFNKFPPSSFKIVHQSSSDGDLSYAIGSLTTNGETFRTYILLKKSGSEYKIQQIKFTED